MPSQFTFYSDKMSETIVSTESYGMTVVTNMTANVLSSPNNNTQMGTLFIKKINTLDNNKNVWSEFEYKIKLDSGIVIFNFNYFNQTTTGENPTELIPAGKDSVVLTTGLLSSSASGIFCNQFGYVNKTKNASQFRQFDVYFPQMVCSYTNVFNSLPQPNTAPLC